MINAAPSTTSDAIQLARAAHLRDLLEPWSLRRLEARTGLGRGTLQGRLNGNTAITFDDVVILAPVIRMSPEELFVELLSVQVDNGTPDTQRGGGADARGLLRFVGPTGLEPMTSTVEYERLAEVLPFTSRRAS